MQSPEKIAEEEESGMGEVGAPGTDHGVRGSAEEWSELIPGTGGHRWRTLSSSSRRKSKILTPTLKDWPGRGEAGVPYTIPGPEGAPRLDDHQRTLSTDLNPIGSRTTSLKDWPSGSECWKKLCKKPVIWGLLVLAVITVVITVVILCVKIGNVPACKCPSCPNKWTKYDDLCYFVSKNSAMWLASHQYCEKEGGSLLILNDTVQQQIEELVLLRHDHWIGLQKVPGSKEWKWVNRSIYRGPVRDGDDLRMNCAYINGGIGALDCSSARPWICMKSL